MFLYIFFAFIVIQRLIEMYIARRNAEYILSIGGYEVGKRHYPAIVLLHVTFLTSFFIESLTKTTLPFFWFILFIIFVFAQILRIWIIASLGPFWNTRIIVLPSSQPIKKGPYKFLRHPNYTIVMIEMITIPLIFGAYITAIAFPILNAIVLFIRIKAEENALSNITQYGKEFSRTPRFIPKLNK